MLSIFEDIDANPGDLFIYSLGIYIVLEHKDQKFTVFEIESRFVDQFYTSNFADDIHIRA